MNLRRFVFMVATTVMIGILIGTLNAVTKIFTDVGLFFGMQMGGFVSATALMGFWAYLTLNFLVRGMIPQQLWKWIQLVIIAVVYIDFIYLRYMFEGQGTQSVWPYIWFATWPLLIALAMSYLKAKDSGRTAFVPAFFFLYVFTVVEWYVALRMGVDLKRKGMLQQEGLITVIGTILIGCNSYLILILGRLLRRPSSGRRGAETGARAPQLR